MWTTMAETLRSIPLRRTVVIWIRTRDARTAQASAPPFQFASAWIRGVSDRPVPDGENTNDPLVAVDLVDDPVRTDAKRPEPAKAPTKRMTCIGFAFKDAERLNDGIGQRPVEIDDLFTGPSGELDPAHLPVSAVELSAQLIERHSFPSRDLLTTFFDGSERVGIGEDLGRLLQGLIFVHRNKHSRGTAPPGDDHVLSEVSNLIDKLAELATKLSNRNRLTHALSVPKCVHLGKEGSVLSEYSIAPLSREFLNRIARTTVPRMRRHLFRGGLS